MNELLVVQWLRLLDPSAGGPGLIPGQGTNFHMSQLRVCMLKLKKKKIPPAATRSCMPQLGPSTAKINKY